MRITGRCDASRRRGQIRGKSRRAQVPGLPVRPGGGGYPMRQQPIAGPRERAPASCSTIDAHAARPAKDGRLSEEQLRNGVNLEQVKAAVVDLLKAIGEDPERE